MITTRVSSAGHLTISEHGVFLHPANAKTRPGKKVAERIQVRALVTREGTTNKSVDLGFIDCNGEFAEVTISPSDFADFRRFRTWLLDNGYKFPADPKIAQMLHSYVVEQAPIQRRHVLHRPGWYENHYVFADERVRLTDRVLSFQAADPAHARNFGTAGTLEGWKTGVAKYGCHSTRLTFSISLALASALLRFTDVESGGIHLTGDSGIGKTTSLLVAASVGGKAIRDSLFSWDSTKTGLDELAAAYNDNLLGLDEIERAPDTAGRAKEIRDAAFRLAGGTGRIRSALYGAKTGKQSITWRLFFISTGETSLNEVAHIESMKRLKGEQVRAIDLPGEVHDQFGIFESLPAEYTDSRKLVENIEVECQKNYGVALREFVKCVARDSATISADIEALMQMFFTDARVPEKRWEHRFSKRFALAYAAVKLAIKYEIVPWDGRMVAHAIKACYEAARSCVPDASTIRNSGLVHLRDRLTRADTVMEVRPIETRDVDLLKRARVLHRADPQRPHFLVRPNVFKTWFDSDVQADLVLQYLDSNGYLEKDVVKTGAQQRLLRTVQRHITGIPGRLRYHAIRDAFLNDTYFETA